MMSELLHVCFNVISTGKAHMFIVWKFLEISLIKLSRPTGNVDCPEMLLAGVQCGLKPTRNFGFWLTRFPPGMQIMSTNFTAYPPEFENLMASLLSVTHYLFYTG